MKKIIFVLSLVVLIAATGKAQEEPKGNLALDLNFCPAAIFDASAGSMFSMPYIKARYYTSSDFALRMGIGLKFGGNTDYPDPDEDDFDRTSYFGITLAPGFEKFFGSNKFFVYLGAELPISFYNEREKSKVGGDTYITKNPDGDGFIGVGLNLLIGADYYVFNNFYIGAELAPGLVFRKYLNSKDDDGDITAKGGRSVNFDLAASSGLRIGFRF
jgi:hypothetical protein